MRTYGPEYYEKQRERKRAWYAANPQIQREYTRAYRARHPERVAAKRRGVDPTSVTPMPDNCEVCGRPPTSRGLHLDHDHVTGKFRGWLCHQCNVALGMCSDDPVILQKLISYLQRS